MVNVCKFSKKNYISANRIVEAINHKRKAAAFRFAKILDEIVRVLPAGWRHVAHVWFVHEYVVIV